jgi:hypothetical protein
MTDILLQVLLGGGALLAAVFGLIRHGANKQKRKHADAIRRAEDQTHERANDATITTTADDARRRIAERVRRTTGE